VTTRQSKVRPPKVRPPKVHTQLGRAAVQISAAQIFLANDRMNQMLIEHLDPAAWSSRPTIANPPGKNAGKNPSQNNVRNIAAIFTHMHNVRCKWVRLTAPHLKVPSQLHRARCTPQQARAGLAMSAARCAEMLAEALGGEGRVEKFRRDGWARPWPVGVEMLCYMLSHEAHHRGQVCMLAHQLGFPLPIKVTSGIWNWEKLWKECGARGSIGGDS
jgi:uncharacterized damage-inducible protein DinB